MKKLEFGVIARDKVTGFTGMITAKTSYITGCDRYYLTPKVDKDGKCQEGKFFDEGTLEYAGHGLSLEDVITPEERDARDLKEAYEKELQRRCEEHGDETIMNTERGNKNKDSNLKRSPYDPRRAKSMPRVMQHILKNHGRGGPHDNDPTIENGGLK